MSDAADQPTDFQHTYELADPIPEKIDAIVRKVYGGDGAFLLPAARDKVEALERSGLGGVPICMAKTHLSLSHDIALTNAPTGFTVTVRDLRAYTGAGWIVALCGDMQTMPGLSRRRPPSRSTSTRPVARWASSRPGGELRRTRLGTVKRHRSRPYVGP